MATIREVKKELRHREWAEEIAECQSSGMKIRNWCQMNIAKVYGVELSDTQVKGLLDGKSTSYTSKVTVKY